VNTKDARASLPLLLEPEFVVDEEGRVADGPVRVEGGRIAAIGPAARRAGAAVVPLTGRALSPAFVNAHSHAFQLGLRGHVEKKDAAHAHDDFWTWRTHMYALANALTPSEMRAVARAAFLDMVRAGFTHVGEFHYVHHAHDDERARPATRDDHAMCDAVVEAAADAGIHLTLLETGYARAAPGKPALAGQRRFVFDRVDAFLAHVDDVARAHPHVTTGFAIHSVRACPLDWIAAISARAAELRAPLHVHASEQTGELEIAMAEHGRSPIAILDDAGALTAKSTVVHATHASDDDVARLAARGAVVCLCPTTERNLGDGLVPARALVDAGVPLAIGSDSQTRIDPLLELAAIEEDERLRVRARSVLVEPGQTLAMRLWPIGTANGARALSSDGGRMAVGAPADLVALSIPSSFAPSGDSSGDALHDDDRAHALDALLVSGTREAVRDVFVGGDHVVRDGRFFTIDEAAVAADARRALAAARKRAAR